MTGHNVRTPRQKPSDDAQDCAGQAKGGAVATGASRARTSHSELQRVVLVIPAWQPLSMNALERQTWHARHNYRSAWIAVVATYWLDAGRPTFTHPTITIRCYYKAQRRRDADNAAGGVGKIVLDALKGRAFGDDDAGSVDLQPVELLLDPSNPRVEIELREAA